MAKMDPLLEEAAVASLSMAGLGGFIALLYYLLTDFSPWPGLVLGEVGGLGFGIAILALTSPKRR